MQKEFPVKNIVIQIMTSSTTTSALTSKSAVPPLKPTPEQSVLGMGKCKYCGLILERGTNGQNIQPCSRQNHHFLRLDNGIKTLEKMHCVCLLCKSTLRRNLQLYPPFIVHVTDPFDSDLSRISCTEHIFEPCHQLLAYNESTESVIPSIEFELHLVETFYRFANPTTMLMGYPEVINFVLAMGAGKSSCHRSRLEIICDTHTLTLSHTQCNASQCICNVCLYL